MKILHVTHSYWPATFFGGPIFSTLGLCEALAQIPGVELRVLSTDAAGPSSKIRLPAGPMPQRYPPGYDVFFVRQTAQNLAPRQIPWIWSLTHWADCILVTGTYSFHVIPSLLIARITRKPLLWSPRGALLDSHQWRGHRRPSAKRLYERACRLVAGPKTQFVVTSAEEAAACGVRVRGIPANVVTNGTDVPNILDRKDWRPGGTLRLISLGRLDPKKGLENLIAAMVLLEKHVTLDIYGQGDTRYEQSLRELADRSGVADRVRFLGHVDGLAKTDAFMQSDLFVLPSHSENFAMVVAEAMAHGIPAIVSRAAPWSEIVERGAGLWVFNSPEVLAGAVTQLSERNLQEMGELAREWVTQEFSWKSRADELMALFRTMAGGLQSARSAANCGGSEA